MIQLSQRGSDAVEVTCGGECHGLLRVFVVRPGNDGLEYPRHCRVIRAGGDELAEYAEWVDEDGSVTASLSIRPGSAGGAGAFSASGVGHAIVQLVWELADGSDGFQFMPAFMYGRNEGGRSPWATYPQLSESDTIDWARPWSARQWLVRTDRSSHAFTSNINGGRAQALGGRDVCRRPNGAVAEKTGLGISSLSPRRLTFSLGFANVPYTYSNLIGRNFHSRPEGYVDLERGDVSAEVFLLVVDEPNRQRAASRLLRESYAILRDRVQDAGTVEDGVRAVADALAGVMYCSEARNFYLGLCENERMMAVLRGLFSTAWSGGVRTAYPLLLAGHQLGETGWVACAREVMDDVAANGVSTQSGLFNDNFDLNTGEWSAKGWWYRLLERPGHAGYVSGQACHYLLLGYLAEKQAGVEQSVWLDSAAGVLDCVAATQRSDGLFGYTYSEDDGGILDAEGFSGCWFVPAFATLFRVTGREHYLSIARKSMDAYRRFVEELNLWGGPPDTFKCPDEEGVLAWIEAARILHELTGEEVFLNDLLMGLDYEFSWKFAYNVVNEVEPLKSMGWCSTGGSVTSVNNSHIHPMGGQIGAGILHAAEITGDEYLWSRLADTVRWTLTAYLHHDGHYGWGRRGLINERFCYTDSLLLERFPDGTPAGTWFFAHSWASGAVLESLAGRILDFSRTERAREMGIR